MESKPANRDPSADSNFVLIISTGKNDLQVIGTDSKGNLIARPTGRGGRRLHRYFLQSADVITEWQGIRPGKESRRNYYDLKKGADPAEFPSIEFEGKKEFLPINRNGRYQLYPGKLTRLVEELKNKEIRPDEVLVIYTDRPPLADNASGDRNLEKNERRAALALLRDKKFYEDEPIAAGPLLARWLAEQFEIDPADDEGAHFRSGKKACWVNVHQGVTTLEGHDDQGRAPRGRFHYPVALPIARVVDLAVKDLAENIPVSSTAILSHTGGMADLKDCLNASVRFRFGNRVVESHESELQATEFDLARDRKLSDTPRRSDSLLTRLHVEHRIWEGDYVGALAVASHIRPDDVHDRWCFAVRAIHDLFLGLDGDAFARFPAAERIWKLPSFQRDSVLAAFRVEAALQHSKGAPLIAEAVKGLVTLRDILLGISLIEKLDSLGIVVDRDSGDILSGKEKIQDEWKRKNWINEQRMTLFAGPMANFLECLLKPAGEPVGDHPVIVLNRAIEKNWNQKNNSLTFYRNRAIHSTLFASQIAACEALGKTKGIWIPCPNDQKSANLGGSFLGQPILKNALSLFDLDEPDQCYRNLNEALFQAIREPIALDDE